MNERLHGIIMVFDQVEEQYAVSQLQNEEKQILLKELTYDK
jgi:hypothetical protein